MNYIGKCITFVIGNYTEGMSPFPSNIYIYIDYDFIIISLNEIIKLILIHYFIIIKLVLFFIFIKIIILYLEILN